MKYACLILALITGAAHAAEVPVIPEEIAIPPGETRAFEFGTLPQADTTILLEVQARLDAKAFSGSMFFLRVRLNGKEVKAAKSRTALRLVNKPLVSPVAHDLPAAWYGTGGWRVVYGPDFEGARQQRFYEGDPYTLVLDVTDLTNPAAENRLEITNTANPNSIRYAGTEGNLVISKLTVRTQPGKSPTMTGSDAVAPVINNGQPGAGPAAYQGELLPGGGFALTVGGRRWEFASDFSYPNAGLNRLTAAAAPDTTGQPGWKVDARPGKAGGTVVASGPDYRVRRTVRFTARKVEVEDAITNAHADAPLGMLVRHQTSLEALENPVVRLAGNPDPAVDDYYSPSNPSVYVAMADYALGMLCEDDVFRNQARLYCTTDPPAAGIRTEMLRLGPGETYTLRWSIYPVASRDYYDFINLVREDWGSNFTVLGAWTFFSPDAILAMPLEEIREQYRRQGIRYACSYGGWVDAKHDRKRIGFGTGVLDDYWADFRGRLKAAAARIREACPEVKVLVYYDSQRDTSEGGHERFKDSWLTNTKGEQLSTEWSGQYSLTYSVVATVQNSYGKAMLTVADRYLDEIGADGLYWDEMECVGYGAPLLTYNILDGHSCILDPKSYTIQREVGITTLLGEGHRLAVIDRVRKRGGFLMGNGPACTRAILATGVQRMVEIQHNDYWFYEGLLGTPLGYASGRTDFGNVTRALRFGFLLVGTRHNYPHEISRYLFPFTPIELHHGYLLGKERIITLHPGKYGWPGERCLVQVRHFNREGMLTETDYPTTVEGESRTAIQPAEEEVVVLERLPVTLDPRGGKAEVSRVRYSAEGLALSVTAPRGATLRITTGAFEIRPGARYSVRIGSQPARTVTPEKGILTVVIPAGAATPVTVSPAGAPVPG